MSTRRLTFLSHTFLILCSVSASAFERFVDPLPIPQKLTGSDINVTLSQFKTRLHRDLPEAFVWGYNGISPGPTIEVESGKSVHVHWKNALPTTHLLASPKGAAMDMAMPDVRAVTHLHGAAVSQPSRTDRSLNSDGWPDSWITSGQTQNAEYPNLQSARTLWYHDHAMGETGRNVEAGLIGTYIIHDAYERSLNLPSGDFDIPLQIQARGVLGNGSLYYTTDITKEFYGNAVAVNGKLWPYLSVEPRKYRFRIVNSSNARSYAMKLTDEANQSAGPEFYQVGSDAGFLENTVILNDPKSAPNDPKSMRLTLAPAERADIVIDFSKYAGRNLVLENNSIDLGDAELPMPVLMLFKVGTTLSHPDTSSLPMKMKPIARISPRVAVQNRSIVLNDMIGSDGTDMMMLNGKSWSDPITEKPKLGTTEIWSIIDTLTDAHPIHIHLVQFQIMDRTPFDVDQYKKTGKLVLTGAAENPDPNEMGWKDVVRTRPGMVTRIIMKFGPYKGYYVYHCHILEHEDMDMMRPFQVE